VTITVAGLTLRSDRRDDTDVAATDPSTAGVFDAHTDTVLVFSDGIDGITALDLDTGIAARRVIEGERAGDQPYRINLVDQHLVVGWGEIYAAPLDSGPSVRIDSATIFIPSAEPGEVWTVNYTGGAIGSGHAEIHRVTMDGTIVISTDTLDTDHYYPLYGVPGGLVVQGPEGLAIWDAASGLVGDPIAPGVSASHLASDGTHLASCDETCEEPQVVDLEQSGRPTTPAGGPGQRLALSPDGSHLAVLRPTAGGRAELVVIDLATGEQTHVATTPPGNGSLQWADDGRQLFYATDSYASDTTTLGRYDLPTGTWEAVELDLGDNTTFVPVARGRATALLTGQRVEPAQCPSAEGVFPSGRTEPCTFQVSSRTVEANETADPAHDAARRAGNAAR
jgi:hypothetical protein